MSKKLYWMLVSAVVTLISLIFVGSVPALSRFLNIDDDHILAYLFLLVGLSVFYFGVCRPHWFAQEIIPSGKGVKFKVEKKPSLKAAFHDDSYFWNLFPFALFFTFAGLAYLLYPSPYSMLVAFACSAWVKVLYKLV